MGSLRWLTAGESHGPALVATLEGLPAGVPVTTAMVADALARRRLGYGRGARMKFEQDEVTFLGGVRHGETMGSPVAVMVGNTEWPKWEQVMSADPVDPEVLAGLARNEPLTRPRPGHADLAGMQKYSIDEARPILERASARETAARVALGAVARSYLKETCGIEIVSHVVELAAAKAPAGVLPLPADEARLDEDPVRCLDADASKAMVAEIDQAHKDGDTLGGVVEVLAYGVPVGLGSHVHWDRRLDARLAAALMGIQAIKGVEVGDGFELARIPGSQAHDEILPTPDGVKRASGRSGGTEGGLSTGELLRVRAAMKPIATVPRALQTLDVRTGEPAKAHHQRSDVCAVPAAGIVAEAMVALVLADAVAEKFGGDNVSETRRNVQSYLDNLIVR
ncbi:chorismate synthase [Kitasatospora cheerisanensis]|uniref:Chorismate synthase n=1 Tax=Kitasatospora cheerisanensis KCTC 2395 TaxID=1348663 RepID=A0A066Z3W1_9ACTN|nr:chorismate synthase [Kitasatospora cheerisanensis]KDN86939.1 chorismate synthase [Kitasatospora cheerisanensis KCTC 2395]